MCALRRIANAVPKITDTLFQRKYIALGRLVTQWKNIVGEKLATHATPIKLHYRKPKQKGDKPEVTLDIATSSAYASILVMQKGVLLEKINHIYGETLVSDIRFVHLMAPTSKPASKKTKTLNEHEKNSLSALLDNVEDTELKNRLASYGEAFYKDQK